MACTFRLIWLKYFFKLTTTLICLLTCSSVNHFHPFEKSTYVGFTELMRNKNDFGL